MSKTCIRCGEEAKWCRSCVEGIVKEAIERTKRNLIKELEEAFDKKERKRLEWDSEEDEGIQER